MVLFYALILLIPFNNHPLLSQLVMGLTPIKWVGAAAVVYAFFYMAGKRPERPLSANLQVGLFILLIIIIFSSLFVNSLPISGNRGISRSLALIPFLFVSYMLVDTKEKLRKTLIVIVISMCIGTAYIVKGYVMYSALYGSGFRPGGSFGDPNYYALSAVCVVPIAYYLFKVDRNKQVRFFSLGAMCFITLGILVSLSRGGMIALVAAFLMIMINKKGRLKGLIIGVFVVVILAVAFMPDSMWERISTMRQTVMMDVGDSDVKVERSTEHRLELLKAGMEMVRDYPLMGIGIGMFKPVSAEYLPEFESTRMAHNSYLSMAAEVGLPGFAVFLLIMIVTVRDLRRIERFYKDKDTVMAQFCVAIRVGFVSALIAAFFLSAQYEKMLWLLVFLTLSLKRIAMSEPALEEQEEEKGKEEKSEETLNVSAV